ncbi:macro domain-like protein [Mytilinidion resinicola]|uniref:Macro domain-like protein n=1 Tax=Mytilinidion resinicola TaxID=574789 RepID=A0A6A6Z226_9PEZI|nr:macro domain-like protein [Mytilinidion resinicola]KAF2814858.1 macro domain-like protein [Mytilinidion resinicola]
MGMASSTPSRTPHIQLLCAEERFSSAFLAACEKHKLPSSVQVSIHDYSLSQLPSNVKFDTIVSPANSYGRLDGAFDDAISRALSPKDDYLALTHVAQATLYRQWRGFAPPGTCTLVRIPDEFQARSRSGKSWGTKRVALCPTMRRPSNVTWDREVVYECVWSLLCAVDNHNRSVREAKEKVDREGEAVIDEEIQSILMTPLATGAGGLSAEIWSSQAVLALKHFVDASENPEKWSRLDWVDLAVSAVEVETTWRAKA